jgi:hypothetical protein
VLDHSEEFAWGGEGEDAEILIHAPDEPAAERTFGRTLPVARLPGVRGPV